MRVLYIVLFVLLYHNISQAQNFTAQSFCQNPRAFICNQNSNNTDPALRNRITEIVDRLKERHPSFAEFMNERGFEPTLEELMGLNGEFRLYLGRRIVQTYLELSPELAGRPQSEIDFTGMYNSYANTVATDYLMIPEKEIGQYAHVIQRQFQAINGFSAEESKTFFSEIVSADPLLNQANTDFGITNVLDLEQINEELTASMRSLFQEEIAAGLARHQAQFSAQRDNMRETLMELGYAGSADEIDSRLSGASLNLASSDQVSCNSTRRLFVNNASIETGTGRMLRCPDNYVLFSNQEHMNVFSNHHELGHLFDHDRSRDNYHPSYVQCIQEELGADLHSGQGHRSIADDVNNSMVELTADYVGVAATVRYLRNNNLSETESLRLLQREFQGLYCNDLGASTVGDHGHADNDVRLNRILGGSPQLQEYLGCSRFAGSVPVNPCHPFQDNGSGVDPAASSGPVED